MAIAPTAIFAENFYISRFLSIFHKLSNMSNFHMSPLEEFREYEGEGAFTCLVGKEKNRSFFLIETNESYCPREEKIV